MNIFQMKKENGLLLVAICMFVLYALGIVFPDSFWGLHYPAFLSNNFGVIFIVLAIVSTLYFQNRNPWVWLLKESKNAMIWRFGLAFVGFILFYKMPIFNDVYGDSLQMLPNRDLAQESLDPVFLKKIFSFDFTNFKLGTGTTFGLVGWISYQAQISVYDAFRMIGAICGAGYIYFMLASIHRLTSQRIQRVLLTIVVFGAPLLLTFCGHIEIYAPVYFFLAVFWYLVIRYHEKPSTLGVALLFVVALLNFKFHVTGFLTIVTALIMTVLQYRRSKGWGTNWKNLFLAVIMPVYLLGIYVYTMVTRSTFGARSYSEETIFDVVFLPIKSSEGPPLDRYNLFSSAHFFDFFNLWFLWSAGALFLILSLLLFYRKRIDFAHPLVQVMGVSLLIYLPIFFVLNPLLSMQTDWDLMSIPGVLMILFAIILVTTLKQDELKSRSFESYAMTPVIGFMLMGMSSIFVNANQESQAERLISMGGYSFRTYWIGASTPVLNGINGLPSERQKINGLEAFIRDNEASAVKGNDVEFSAVINALGNMYQNSSANPNLDLALTMYQKAYEYQPMYRKNVYDLLFTHFLKKDFKEANMYVPTLVKMRYPNPIKSLRVAVHTSIEAEDYKNAVIYCQLLIKENPDDTFIKEILRLLQTEEDKSSIKFKFRQN